MFQLAMIGLYPFWFATGFFPRRTLAVDPKASLVYANLAYWCFGILHWYDEDVLHVFIGLAVNWLLVLWWCKPRWQVAILLAWAATDLISLWFDLHSKLWDWLLFGLIAYRSYFDSERG
jgi:hypothetical protein